MTVRLQNTRDFPANTEIPLGYWNHETLRWEHHGTGTVDANGEWLVMQVTHFSPFDCNDPISPPEEAPTTEDDQTGDDPEPCSPPDCSGCGGVSGQCTIDSKSGIFTEQYRLPTIPVLGRDVTPQLLYSSRRVLPATVIDLAFSMETFQDPNAQVGEDISFELFLNGEKRDRVTHAFQPGQEYRYRSFWEARDLKGDWLAPGIYDYHAILSVPYRTQYYWSKTRRFGGPPDYDRPTGVYVDHTVSVELRGTLTIDAMENSPFGAGWVLAGQQRLYENEAGQILIADGRRNTEFYYPNKNLLRPARRGLSERLVWTNSRAGTIQSMETSTGLTSRIEVGAGPLGLVISPDGARSYVTLEGGEALSIVNLAGDVDD